MLQALKYIVQSGKHSNLKVAAQLIISCAFGIKTMLVHDVHVLIRIFDSSIGIRSQCSIICVSRVCNFYRHANTKLGAQ